METNSSVLFCMPHLRPWKHSFRVHPVYPVYHEGSLASFSTSFAINHVN